MATPNQMPKKPNKLREQMLSHLIETKPSGWTQKILAKDDDGKEIVNGVIHDHRQLKWPLAENVSDFNVDRAAKRWL